MDVIGPHNGLRFCINQGHARRLRPLDARTIREQAASDLAPGRFGFLLNPEQGSGCNQPLPQFGPSALARSFCECARKIRFIAVLWSDVDFGIGNLRMSKWSDTIAMIQNSAALTKQFLHGTPSVVSIQNQRGDRGSAMVPSPKRQYLFLKITYLLNVCCGRQPRAAYMHELISVWHAGRAVLVQRFGLTL